MRTDVRVCYDLRMKLDLRSYIANKTYSVVEEVDFSSHEFSKTNRIQEIVSCHVEAKITMLDKYFTVSVSAKGKLKALCSYTLEVFERPYSVKEDMIFNQEENSESEYFEPNLVFDFDPYLLALIDATVPLNVTKPGAKLPSDGKGYRVLTEEEYKKEKEKVPDPRWAKLDNIDLD